MDLHDTTSISNSLFILGLPKIDLAFFSIFGQRTVQDVCYTFETLKEKLKAILGKIDLECRAVRPAVRSNSSIMNF
jgi:hypothetical protein